MKDRLSIGREIQRKTIHLTTSFLPIAYYYLSVSREQILFICVFITIGFLIADLLRMFSKAIEKYFKKIFSKLLREPEIKNQLTGATYLFIGLTLSVILFPRHIAVPAMLFLTLADPFAAIIGKIYDLKKIFNKSLGGFIAFFTMATIVVLLFTNLRVYGILIAFLAAIVEILPLKINDNLTVPIVSGYLFMIIS